MKEILIVNSIRTHSLPISKLPFLLENNGAVVLDGLIMHKVY